MTRLANGYFEWLCSIVKIDRGAKTYKLLAEDLMDVEFVSLVPHDENRIMDAMMLRSEYVYKKFGKEVDEDAGIREENCSIFEVLIGIARRMDFELSDPEYFNDRTDECFWELIDNLGLSIFSDDAYKKLDGAFNVEVILRKFVNRDYAPNGEGGLFPIANPDRDQRDVEIFFQMQEYLNEKQMGDNYGTECCYN